MGAQGPGIEPQLEPSRERPVEPDVEGGLRADDGVPEIVTDHDGVLGVGEIPVLMDMIRFDLRGKL